MDDLLLVGLERGEDLLGVLLLLQLVEAAPVRPHHREDAVELTEDRPQGQRATLVEPHDELERARAVGPQPNLGGLAGDQGQELLEELVPVLKLLGDPREVPLHEGVGQEDAHLVIVATGLRRLDVEPPQARLRRREGAHVRLDLLGEAGELLLGPGLHEGPLVDDGLDLRGQPRADEGPGVEPIEDPAVALHEVDRPRVPARRHQHVQHVAEVLVGGRRGALHARGERLGHLAELLLDPEAVVLLENPIDDQTKSMGIHVRRLAWDLGPEKRARTLARWRIGRGGGADERWGEKGGKAEVISCQFSVVSKRQATLRNPN